jgi:hypothetical protein
MTRIGKQPEYTTETTIALNNLPVFIRVHRLTFAEANDKLKHIGQ